MIPARLIRTVPTDTSDEVEAFWDGAAALHPGWEMVTYRDPIDPVLFPMTSPHWERCTTGAQLAGLIRLEALWHRGGIYIDSDFECFRPFTPLLGVPAFAGWEDAKTVPDAVIGAEPGHLAIGCCLHLAILRLTNDKARADDWKQGRGAWSTGPGVTTTTLPGRDDVLLLAPGSLYPYHYTEKQRRHDNLRALHPYAFGAHHWHASWLQK